MKIAFGVLFAILMLMPCLSAQEKVNLDLKQSSSSIRWRSITSPYARVVFPDYLEESANNVINLIEHYSHVAGESYGIEKPEQIIIVMRPETANPNGFVTLSPRRSEWFNAYSNSPFIGSLNFYQALSIHEYRHVNQFDYLNQKTTKLIYYLFGEKGQEFAIGMGVPPWFFEGDAVWAETTYTDGGRGRSPRFPARLKALLTSAQTPSYDAFLAGSYNTNLPNHYVYGYFLITRAYKLYGPDVWKKIMAQVSRFPLNPYAITNQFQNVTGKNFEEFYNETMAELEKEWARDFTTRPSSKHSPYVNYDYPMMDGGKLYYLKKNLDSYWGLYASDSAGERLIHEFKLTPAFSRVDVKHNKFVYTEIASDSRFQYREYSDVFVYDLGKGKTQRISENGRYYHPQLSPDGDEILAVEANKNSEWELSVLDFKGRKKQQLNFGQQTVNEAVWKDKNHIYAILQDHEGYKSIAEIELGTKSIRTLMNRTRDNIYALNLSGQKLFFEADLNGKVQIIRLDVASKRLAVCTNEPIAAYRPFAKGALLLYAREVADGTRIVHQNLDCKVLSAESLQSFAYIGHTPSDDFQESKPVPIDNYEAMINKRTTPVEDYSEMTAGILPHSWTFFGGRGLFLSLSSANYLNTFHGSLAVGRDGEEKQPYSHLQFDLLKYYPIFSLKAGYSKRKSEDPVTHETIEWDETGAALAVSLPYSFTYGLYEGWQSLSLSYGFLKAGLHRSPDLFNLSDDQLFTHSVEYSFAYLKTKRFRERHSPLGFSLDAFYQDNQAQDHPDFSSWQTYGKFSLFIPGLMINHGMEFSISAEERPGDLGKYRGKSFAQQSVEGSNAYVFSRGYDYEYAQRFAKGSYEYTFPLAYPDANGFGWIFLKRIDSNLFFDYTHTELQQKTAELKSAGLEMLFETLFLRKAPLTLGARWVARLSIEKGSKTELFLASNVLL